MTRILVVVQGHLRLRWSVALTLLCVSAWVPKASAAAHEHCGDGVVDPDEACDDGNRDGGDGCSATCRNEVLPCGLADPSAASCQSDQECGFGNACQIGGCTPSFCGCSDSGPIYCTRDCQGTCVKKEVIICRDQSRPECTPENRNGDVFCVDFRGNATPRPNADRCWTDGDCGPTGLCVARDCVGSTCFCTPGQGWSCTEDCVEGGLECRYPGDRLPAHHPVCVEMRNASNDRRSCIYPAQAQAVSPAPVLGGFVGLLGLGLLGLRRRVC